MVNLIQLKNNFKVWILGQVDKLATNTPIIKYTKPFIKRSIDKQLNSIDKFFNLIADDAGHIDIEGILNETINNIKEPEICTIKVPVLGDVHLGNNTIKLGIPMTDKDILLKAEDLELLKEALQK